MTNNITLNILGAGALGYAAASFAFRNSRFDQGAIKTLSAIAFATLAAEYSRPSPTQQIENQGNNTLRLYEVRRKGIHPFLETLSDRQIEELCDFYNPLVPFEDKCREIGLWNPQALMINNTLHFLIKKGALVATFERLKGLQHPSILTPWMFFEKEEGNCLIFKAPHGEPLSQIKTIKNDFVLKVASLASALLYLESLQLQHQDLNAKNILVTKDSAIILNSGAIVKKYQPLSISGSTLATIILNEIDRMKLILPHRSNLNALISRCNLLTITTSESKTRSILTDLANELLLPDL